MSVIELLRKPLLWVALAALGGFTGGWTAHRPAPASCDVTTARLGGDAGTPEVVSKASEGPSEASTDTTVTVKLPDPPRLKPRKVSRPDGGVAYVCPSCPKPPEVVIREKCDAKTGPSDVSASAPVLPPVVVTTHDAAEKVGARQWGIGVAVRAAGDGAHVGVGLAWSPWPWLELGATVTPGPLTATGTVLIRP